MPISLRCLAFFVVACLTPTLSAGEKAAFYDPFEKQIEGWTVAVDPLLVCGEHAELGEKALKALANHLQRVTYIVPPERLKQLKKLRIWIELENPQLGNMQYHPDRGWLKAHGQDPRLAKHVHIPRARNLLAPRMWAKHPYVVLHELAHSYHDQVLGFDQPAIVETYNDAKEKGIYEEVLLFTGKKVRHYGLTNHKEYFAESTEAYFGVNDFYPFVRAELKQHDPNMFALLEKIWGPVGRRPKRESGDENGTPRN
jgi:dipeptidyl-peptidase-4